MAFFHILFLPQSRLTGDRDDDDVGYLMIIFLLFPRRVKGFLMVFFWVLFVLIIWRHCIWFQFDTDFMREWSWDSTFWTWPSSFGYAWNHIFITFCIAPSSYKTLAMIFIITLVVHFLYPDDVEWVWWHVMILHCLRVP